MADRYKSKQAAISQQELNGILRAHEAYVARRGGLRANLAHQKLDGLILANCNLEEADFSGASLVGAKLYGSNLYRATLFCADLRGCDLRMAKLTRANLRGASFKGATLAYAVLDKADLRAGTMMIVGTKEISLIDRNRSGQNPTGVDFSNCSLKGASFGDATLDGANFSGAMLQGASFKNATLTNAVFKNAVLTGVHLAELHVPPEALAESIRDILPQAMAKCDDLKSKIEAHQQWIITQGKEGCPAVLDGEDLRPMHEFFTGRRLSGLSARHVVGIGLDFSESQLQAAKFEGADLRGANFSRADLRGASFKGAKLAHANFEGADLGALEMANGTKLLPDLAGAELMDQQLHNAIRDQG